MKLKAIIGLHLSQNCCLQDARSIGLINKNDVILQNFFEIIEINPDCNRTPEFFMRHKSRPEKQHVKRMM